MNRRTTLFSVAEVVAWWAALAVLWLVFISAVDTLELGSVFTRILPRVGMTQD